MFHDKKVVIELPEDPSSKKKMPLILSIGPSFTMAVPVVLMALLSSRIYSTGGGSFVYMSLVTGLSAAFMSMIWAVFGRLYKDREEKNEKDKIKSDYLRYLSSMDGYLSGCMKDNLEYLSGRYASSCTLLEVTDPDENKRYNRSEDLLTIRLGLGTVPFQMEVSVNEKGKIIRDDPLYKKAVALTEKYRYIKKCPVTVNLKTQRRIALVADKLDDERSCIIFYILLQILLYTSEMQVRTALIYDEGSPAQEKIKNTLKFMPHFGRGDVRLFAGCQRDLLNVLPVLDGGDKKNPFHTILFVLNEELIKGEALYERINDDEDESLSVILYKNKKEVIPAVFCASYHLPERGSDEGMLCLEDNNDIKTTDLISDMTQDHDLDRIIRWNAGQKKLKDGNLYDTSGPVPYLLLFDCDCIDNIDTPGRYIKNRPDESIKVPMGFSENGRKLYLNLNEKFHGPHGLIAGTTGSGKSELIETFILSLVLSYSPYDVNFFIIDYKGGGTGNHLKDLPHCSGAISNLSGGAINRAITAIGAESKLRQKIFEEHGLCHIDEYTELFRKKKVEKPLPHLVIIIDEFAELKSNEPSFMQQIISLFAVGRSLGIHLILATQKPSGVVDERIFSNSRFKLCLKVRDIQDSTDMLHRKEAAYLKYPGQCYLQVGNDEIFTLFKAGYLKVPYRGDGKKKGTVRMLSPSGIRSVVHDEDKEKYPLLMDALKGYIKKCVSDGGYEQAEKLWTDELPDQLYLSDKDSSGMDPGILLLKFDDLYRKEQKDLYYDPGVMGHLCIIGGPSSGKSTALSNILFQLDRQGEGQRDTYILCDLSQRVIERFGDRKNNLGSLFEKEYIGIFFYHLEKLFLKRKAQRQKDRIFIVIDNMNSFLKALNDEQSDLIFRMISEGISINIFFVMTAMAVSEFTTRIYGKIKTSVALELNDRFQYGDVLREYHIGIFPKSATPGRCLVKVNETVMEGQFYRPPDKDLTEDKEGAETVRDLPGRFPRVKKDVMFEDILNDMDRKKLMIPVGYSQKSGYLRGVRIERRTCFLISGGDAYYREELLKNMHDALLMINGIKEDRVAYLHEIKNRSFPEELRFLFIKGLGDFIRDYQKGLYDGALSGSIKEKVLAPESMITVIGDYDPQRDSDIMLTNFFKQFIYEGNGIHLGGNLTSQRAFAFSDLKYPELNENLKGYEGYMCLKGVSASIKVRIAKIKGREDEYDID